jgi:protein subunit release factor A
MDKLVQKVNYNLPNSPAQQLYMYGEASVEANHAMQEPLQKLYQYENQPDMREKIKEYIGELDTEIDRLENLLKNTDSPYDLQIKGRLNAIIEVKNDLLGRLEEVI